MNEPLQTSPLARAVERNLFGALLGAVAAALVARVLLLAYQVPEFVLIALLLIGAASGSFVAHYGSRSGETVAEIFRAWNAWLRQVSLKVMLWTLALAAVIGVLTVLTASYDVLGRVAGTIIATAIAAGLLWPMSILADKQDHQASGLLGMASVLLVYLLVIPLIWDLDRQEEEMLISSLVIGLTVPFGMFFLSQRNQPATWIAARVGVGTYLAVVASFLVATWHPGGWMQGERWWATGWWSAACGTLSFASLCGLKRLAADWRWLGVAAALFAWLLIMLSEWGQSQPDENLIVITSSLAVVIAHASLASLAPMKPRQEWLRLGTVFSMAVAALFFDLEVVFAPQRGISMLGRFSGAAAIVASCGSLALIIFARLNRPLEPRLKTAGAGEITHITLICPACQTSMTVPIGDAACESCGLRIRTAVEPPDLKD